MTITAESLREMEEKRAKEAAHNFIDWMEHTHGYVPYGFHRSLKDFYLNAIDWANIQASKLPEASPTGADSEKKELPNHAKNWTRLAGEEEVK